MECQNESTYSFYFAVPLLLNDKRDEIKRKIEGGESMRKENS